MSIHPQRRLQCNFNGCTETGEKHAFQGGYCSEDCKIRAKATDVLDTIQSDHRFCSSCYRPIKTVFRPDDNVTPELRKKALLIRESFIGFEDLTRYAEQGSYGVECTCGNLQHYHAEELLRDGAPYEWFLKLSIERLANEGQFEYTFAIDEFCNAFWETEDFEYALGEAVE
jgi:hypothetical protein